MNDVPRIRNGLNIRLPKSNSLQDKPIKSCLSRFDSSAYNLFQFLLAVSLSMGVHAGAYRQTDDNSNSSGNGGEDAETEAPSVTL